MRHGLCNMGIVLARSFHAKSVRLSMAARQWRREADAQPPASYPTRHTSASPPVWHALSAQSCRAATSYNRYI